MTRSKSPRLSKLSRHLTIYIMLKVQVGVSSAAEVDEIESVRSIGELREHQRKGVYSIRNEQRTYPSRQQCRQS